MKKRMFTLFMLFFLFAPPWVLAKNPEPFVPHQEVGTPAEVVFKEVQKLPKKSPARIEFFKEISKNYKSKTGLDLSEKDFEDLFRQGKVKVTLCDDCRLITAGLENGTSRYWREVKPTEEVASSDINGQNIPLFLIRCANPAKDDVTIPLHTPVRAPALPPPPPPPEEFRPVGCNQRAPLQLLGSSTIGTGFDFSTWSGYGNGNANTSDHNNVIFYPTDCISELDYEKEGLNENN